MFDLKRPCKDCPWRTDIAPYLSAERVAEIVQAMAFQCHKTVDYSDDHPRQGEKPQQCAGLMLMLHRSGRANTIMQVGERLGAFSPCELDASSPVYADLWAAIEAHGGDPQTTLPRWMQRR